jgi:hypothetical protein
MFEKLYQTIIFGRIKKILKDKNLATFKLQKRDLINRLNDYFWDKTKGVSGFWNKVIYKKQVRFYKNAIANDGHTLESCRRNLAENLNNRTDELVTHLIDQDLLRADGDTPPSYYVVNISTWRLLVLFKWIIIQVVFLGFAVAILANLASSYIWQRFVG